MPVDSQTLQLEGMELQLKVWWPGASCWSLLSRQGSSVVQISSFGLLLPLPVHLAGSNAILYHPSLCFPAEVQHCQSSSFGLLPALLCTST